MKDGTKDINMGLNISEGKDKRGTIHFETGILSKGDKKGNILIVDDQIVISTILKYCLEKNNFNVTGIAKSGEEAIALFEATQPDILLVDIALDGQLNGIETVDIIKTKFYNVPHIYITSSQEEDIFNSAKETQPLGYILKPFQENELIKTVELAIDKSRIEKKLRLKNISLSLAYEEINRQKKEIGRKNKDITDSINYAKKIQEAVLPKKSEFYDLFPNSFILESPKDIIGGDFHWFTSFDNKLIVAAIDCTGHGVPGALMSISANNFLNEIVKERRITQPGKILKELNRKIVFTFKDNIHDELETKNGMDIALCTIDLISEEVLFAGAYRPLYRIRDNKLHIINGEFFPIGRRLKKNEYFKTQKLKIKEGDTFYIFTDGYTDQFGGEFNKRFSKKRLQKLLADIQNLNILVHGNVLKYTFDQWKGTQEQLDDVLVIGMRF